MAKSKSKTISTKVKSKSGKSPSPQSQKSQPRSKGIDLGSLFENALQLLTAKRQDLNDLDGHNGNHGDNMVANMRLITQALQSRGSQPPAQALQYASQVLQSQGVGGSSQYYANGLQQAANQFQGRSSLSPEDVAPLLQAFLGTVPAQGHPQQQQAGGSVLEQLLVGMQAQQQQQAGGDLLGQLLGVQPPPQQQPQEAGVDVGDVLTTLLPAGLAFLQAKQAGADTTVAAGQAVMAALAGGQWNPLQAGTARTASGGLIVQGLLRALLGQ